MQPERSIATILFTDIVGSTERATELGDRRWRNLLDQHNKLVRRELRRFQGKEISTAGDSFLAIFDGPALAILCACAIRDRVQKLGLAVRCGLHMGEVEYTDGDVGGVAVHIGARVAARARADEVLVSSTVRDAERGSGWGFEDLGTHELKGISGEWRLFRVTAVPDDAGSLLPSRRQRLARSTRDRAGSIAVVVIALFSLTALYALLGDRGEEFTTDVAPAEAAPGIAVLPFTVHGEGLGVWREGMMDLLSTGLDGAAGLRTISSRTLMARWGEQVSETTIPDLATVLQVATATGARYALLGSALAVGPDVRLVTDIYETGTGNRLGQARTEGAPDSVLMLVDRLAVEVLGVILKEGEDQIPEINLARLTTTSPAALRAYLEGEVLYRQTLWEDAAASYTRAIEADSTFALAYYQLLRTYVWMDDPTFAQRTTELVNRVRQLADRLPAREALIARSGWPISTTPEELDILREVVQRYPDESEVWFRLAELYFHIPASLASVAEADQAFAKAVELDPRSAPYFIHPIHLAFTYYADSARAEQLIERYGELVGDESWAQRHNRLAFGLAFGDPQNRAKALASMDTLDTPLLRHVAQGWFWHPRYGAEFEAVNLARYSRSDDDPGPPAPTRNNPSGAAFLFWLNAFWRGQLERGLAYLDEPSVPPTVRAGWAHAVPAAGLPAPESVLDQWLSSEMINDTVDGYTVLAVGAYALDRGRQSDHARASSELEDRVRRSLADGDSLAAREAEWLLHALDGYALWQRGQREEAVPILEIAQWSGAMIQWWLGELYVELGRLHDAERVFSSIFWWKEPLAQRQLGKVYEQLEEYDKARESYEFFVEYWNDADPELQPMVEEARQAIVRLAD